MEIEKLVLIHGFTGDSKEYEPIINYFSDRGISSYGFVYSENFGQISLGKIAKDFDSFVKKNVDGNFLPIGLSQGGIIVSYWLEFLKGKERCDKCVTISTPFYGTIWASLSSRVGIKELRIGNRFLENIRSSIKNSSVDYYSIWNSIDPAIFPGRSGNLKYSKKNKKIISPSHPGAFWKDESLKFIEEIIEQQSLYTQISH